MTSAIEWDRRTSVATVGSLIEHTENDCYSRFVCMIYVQGLIPFVHEWTRIATGG